MLKGARQVGKTYILKDFCEETPEYHVACAGSLLGIRLSKTSFSVGKVNFLNLYPMTFSEFLISDNSENLVDVMKQTRNIKEIPKLFESELLEKVKNILHNWWNA